MGIDHNIEINCVCSTIFQVQGKCPRGKGFWDWLLASQPFDMTFKEEQKFMLKQMEAGRERAEFGTQSIERHAND